LQAGGRGRTPAFHYLALEGGAIVYELKSRLSPFSPAGRRCRQADEGVPAKVTKTHEFKLITPSSDPSGHLLPAGEKEFPVSIRPICDTPAFKERVEISR